jgi:hypothetical protein
MTTTPRYNEGGWIVPTTPIVVRIEPDECILSKGADDRWVCHRDGHVGLNQPHVDSSADERARS